MVLNEAPNDNDTTHVANNVCLTTMEAQQFSVAAILPASCRKADLPEMRDNDMKTIKVRVDGNKLFPGKEWALITVNYYCYCPPLKAIRLYAQ